MFKITIEGLSHHEPANGRTPEEYQHFLVGEGHKFVHVREWIRGGAKQPILLRDGAK